MTAKEALEELEETFEVLVPDLTGRVMRDVHRLMKTVKTELNLSHKALRSARYDRDKALEFIEKLGLDIEFDLYMTGDLEKDRIDRISEAIKEAA